ncbi:hypothetical protein [Algimonas arctica]|nr:hypothetical protein [Algimonas arctica]
MKHRLKLALLLAFVAPLSACGISGGLKTAPPLWGEAMAEKVADDAAVVDAAVVDAAAQTASSDNPLDADDDDDVGYGIDVADLP